MISRINDFEDYARLVPSLSYKAGGGGGSADGPGTNNVYFRGVASGDNANHSASLPSVGTYLDEQPITTITGALDIHIFDIARSKRSPARRARSTAPPAKPARSVSSPISPSSARPMARLTWR